MPDVRSGGSSIKRLSKISRKKSRGNWTKKTRFGDRRNHIFNDTNSKNPFLQALICSVQKEKVPTKILPNGGATW